MPKLKPSTGQVNIETPFQDEFQRWLCYELKNTQQWNPDLVKGGMVGLRRWEFELQSNKGVRRWAISWYGGPVIVRSDDSVVHIRKGLLIRMGDGRLELT